MESCATPHTAWDVRRSGRSTVGTFDGRDVSAPTLRTYAHIGGENERHGGTVATASLHPVYGGGGEATICHPAYIAASRIPDWGRYPMCAANPDGDKQR